MATLFVRNRRKLGGIQLDAVVNEQYTNPETVTKFPIESGANINDHTIVHNKTYTMTAVVSNTQLGFAQVGEVVDNITGLFGTSNASNVTRSQAAYRDLLALKESGELITVQTGLGLLDNMKILDIRVTQEPTTSRALHFICPMEQLRIVDSQEAKIPEEILRERPTQMQASSPTEEGTQQETEIDEAESSILFQLFDNFNLLPQ